MNVWQMEAQAERVASALERIADALEQAIEHMSVPPADERAAQVAEKIGPVMTHLARHTWEVDRG